MGRVGWWGSGSVPSMTELLDLDRAALTELVESLGQPGYRARQIWRQMYQRGVIDPLAMSDLPAEFRRQLAEVSSSDSAAVEVPDFRRRVDQQGADLARRRRTD